MSKHELICIRCPIGCDLRVELENGVVTKVEGNDCKRGIDYAEKELLNPTRTLTTIVPLIGGTVRMCPVKTSIDISKNLLNDCLLEIEKITVTAPVMVNQVLLPNVLGTGVDIVSTRTIHQK